MQIYFEGQILRIRKHILEDALEPRIPSFDRFSICSIQAMNGID